MLDDFADKRISEFMYKGMDMMENDPLEAVFSHQASQELAGDSSNQSKVSGSRLRQMSQQVKSILTEAKQALHIEQGEDINTMTINEEVQVIEWAPAVFNAIKKMDGITPEMI